ncbi:LuxR family transcriptional regulator [Streptomyces sp. NPDC005925]|uniref:LuxR family transcriptional regulator n=1 Tax=Streptomyces sp. NPDC005925 TaxID=3157172 RepID=UPI0033E07A56
MYGRAQELWLIRQRLRKVSHGQNGLIILDGTRGSGKTELVRQVSATAPGYGFAVLEGQFTRHKKLVLAVALASRTDGRPFPGAAGSGARTGPSLADDVLAAELPHPAPGPVEPDTRPPGWPETRPPVLVALDDVPWDDPDVRAALTGLPLPGTAHRVLWLLSGTGGPPPHELPHDPGTDDHLTHLTLGPLRRRDALRLAADRLGTAPDDTVGRLVEACGGHPGLLSAVLGRLVTDTTYRGPVTAARRRAEALPPRVLTSLLRDDPRLSQRTLSLLRTIATRPRPVHTRELVHLPAGRAVPLLGSVREAAEAGVLVMDGDRLTFRHALVRRAAALLPPRDNASTATPWPPRPASSVPAPATTDATADAATDEETGPLSPREDAIVRLVAQGLTNSQIATRVNLSPHTVNFHLRKIFRKLGVSSRVELVGTRLRTPTRPPTQESRAAHAG